MDKKKSSLILLFSLLPLLLFSSGCPVVHDDPVPEPVPTPVPPEPSPTPPNPNPIRVNVSDLEYVNEPELSKFYEDLAKAVEKYPEYFQVNKDFREVHRRSGVLALEGSLKGKYPNLAGSMDVIFLTVLGDEEDKKIDTEVLSNLLRQISEALK